MEDVIGFAIGGPRLLSPGRMGGGPGWAVVLLLLIGVASRNDDGIVLVGSTKIVIQHMTKDRSLVAGNNGRNMTLNFICGSSLDVL